MDFSIVSDKYQKASLVQSSAADVLIQMLSIQGDEDILDLGCGPGHITQRLKQLTRGRVLGIDISKGMIEQAIANNKNQDIQFEISNAQDINFIDSFDIIFCNSVLQWYTHPKETLDRCYQTLRYGGRLGLQAPATQRYGPNFIQALRSIETDPLTKEIWIHFKSPWLFLDTEKEYKTLFENSGFNVPFVKLETVSSFYSPEEVNKIFETGAAVGYLNPANYDIPVNENYFTEFMRIMKNEFHKQQNPNGKIELTFNRIYLIAEKGKPF